MKVGKFLARSVIGGLFIGHGTQKLAGWFGGPGPEGTAGMMDKLQLHPPKRNALMAGATETAGGTLLALGLATPLAAASLIGTMITAIRTVHVKNGPWVTNGGYEYNLVLIAALTALAEDGPGDPSLDNALGIRTSGPLWAIGALATGAAASAAVVSMGRRAAATASEAYPQEAAQQDVEAPSGDPVTQR